ncbi:hypothetical protein BK735_23540 [Bacillus mycoides]|uniref:hypothetical protein n=1 Tax=Bacillus mycoides TaxID=1405 RepID=UPI000278E098|nr:hypothetical protein [Bacillus mycoides]EJQ62699.1 hypothetical protein IEY_03511 [Bacillus mycoides]EJQ63815.1 hypothetical protein IEW_01822 [Bacillus mycoides]EJV71086.1 hypothetical protein IEU_01823 [Bacillus mycoides]MCU5655824.1 hypothetical protein [Bacillus mycoides]MDR4302533.1 hypothetical protein [Bacillus mycoides]
MSLLRSHICKFIAGVLIIFVISPLPALFITHNYSYLTGFISIFHNLAQPSSISIPTIDWMHEPILFSANQLVHTSNHSSPLFPYIWEIYFLSIVRFTFTLVIGFFISLGIGHLFLKAPNSLKKCSSLFRWIPYSFGTVILQCSVLLSLLYISKFIKFPFFSSFIIVCSTSMIIVMQAIRKWLPFLNTTNEYEIKNSSFLVDTLFIALTSNHKSILSSIILSFVFMECIFHTNGLLQFIVQFGRNAPIVVTIGLLLLYIPYSILSFLQALWTTNHSKQNTYTLTRSISKP